MSPSSPSSRNPLLLWWWWWWWWTWVLGWQGGAVVLGSPAIPYGLTTEAHIYTGPSKPPSTTPATPLDLVITYKKAYASFVDLTVSYNASTNISRLVMKYKDPIDTSHHIITFSLTPGGGNGVDTSTLFNSSSGRQGFLYRLGGLNREQRYRINATGFRGQSEVTWFRLVFITGDDDGLDSIYNLTGIFLVLGISTIIMVVVMACVGYEKLIHQKKDECLRILCCKRKRRGDNSRPGATSSISPEPLVVRDGRGPAGEKNNSAIRY